MNYDITEQQDAHIYILQHENGLWSRLRLNGGFKICSMLESRAIYLLLADSLYPKQSLKVIGQISTVAIQFGSLKVTFTILRTVPYRVICAKLISFRRLDKTNSLLQ